MNEENLEQNQEDKSFSEKDMKRNAYLLTGHKRHKEINDKHLCIGSLASEILSIPLLVVYLHLKMKLRDEYNPVMHGVAQLCSLLSVILTVVGIALLIVAKTKYPESKFANVIMWIYIAAVILLFFASTLPYIMLANAWFR